MSWRSAIGTAAVSAAQKISGIELILLEVRTATGGDVRRSPTPTALAAASHALRGYRDELAGECLVTAKRVWDDDHAHAPALFLHGNTTGGNLEEEELKAAVELLISTHDPRYTQRVDELWPVVENNFEGNAVMAVRALPYMSEAYRKRLATRTRAYNEQLAATRRLC